MNINEQELADAVNTVLEDGKVLDVDYDDLINAAFHDARMLDILKELHGATTTTQLFIAKGSYCNLLREKAEFLLTEAYRTKQEHEAGLM